MQYEVRDVDCSSGNLGWDTEQQSKMLYLIIGNFPDDSNFIDHTFSVVYSLLIQRLN